MPQRFELNPEFASFASHKMNRLEGMLNKSAAFCALLLSKIIEEEFGWEGAASIEIGVYKGKFLSLMERSTQDFDVKIIGVDPFVLPEQDIGAVKAAMDRVGCQTKRIVFYKGYSHDLANVFILIKDRPLYFAHIDGDHECGVVFQDLKLIDSRIDQKGCVLLDDFWNKSHLGVISAVFKYLQSDKPRFLPVAVMNKKLLMVESEMIPFYKNAIVTYAKANSKFEVFGNFFDHRFGEKPFISDSKILEHEVFIF